MLLQIATNLAFGKLKCKRSTGRSPDSSIWSMGVQRATLRLSGVASFMGSLVPSFRKIRQIKEQRHRIPSLVHTMGPMGLIGPRIMD